MKRTSLCLFLFYLFLFSASAQEKVKFRLGPEFGAGSAEGAINSRWDIRQGLNNYNSDYYYYDKFSPIPRIRISDDIYYTFLGVKADLSFFKDKLSLISGLRFSTLSSGINDKARGSRSNNFFFLRQNNEENVDFYSVNTINQTTNYLSIPLELSFIPFRMKRFAFYGKIGSELGFKIKEKTKINFVDSEMKRYEKELLDEIGIKTNSLYATLSASLGAQYQSRQGFRYNLELVLASKQLTKNNSSIISPGTFRGIQLSVQFPLSLTKKD